MTYSVRGAPVKSVVVSESRGNTLVGEAVNDDAVSRELAPVNDSTHRAGAGVDGGVPLVLAARDAALSQCRHNEGRVARKSELPLDKGER